jgi:hypothetical protein
MRHSPSIRVVTSSRAGASRGKRRELGPKRGQFGRVDLRQGGAERELHRLAARLRTDGDAQPLLAEPRDGAAAPGDAALGQAAQFHVHLIERPGGTQRRVLHQHARADHADQGERAQRGIVVRRHHHVGQQLLERGGRALGTLRRGVPRGGDAGGDPPFLVTAEPQHGLAQLEPARRQLAPQQPGDGQADRGVRQFRAHRAIGAEQPRADQPHLERRHAIPAQPFPGEGGVTDVDPAVAIGRVVGLLDGAGEELDLDRPLRQLPPQHGERHQQHHAEGEQVVDDPVGFPRHLTGGLPHAEAPPACRTPRRRPPRAP